MAQEERLRGRALRTVFAALMLGMFLAALDQNIVATAIRTIDDDRQFYFHRNSVLHDDFDNLTVGTEVRFTPELGDQGPQASSVQVVARHSEQA